MLKTLLSETCFAHAVVAALRGGSGITKTLIHASIIVQHAPKIWSALTASVACIMESMSLLKMQLEQKGKFRGREKWKPRSGMNLNAKDYWRKNMSNYQTGILIVVALIVAVMIRVYKYIHDGGLYYRKYPGAKVMDEMASKGALNHQAMAEIIDRVGHAKDPHGEVAKIRAERSLK